MKLLPSLKQKKRYIVFEVEPEVDQLELRKEIDSALLFYLGQYGLSQASPRIIKEKLTGRRFLIKTNHQWVPQTISALILIKKIKNTPIVIRSVITSGTIKKASSYLIDKR